MITSVSRKARETTAGDAERIIWDTFWGKVGAVKGHCCVVCGRGEWVWLPGGNRSAEVGHGRRLLWP